jgi:hypothetical protein
MRASQLQLQVPPACKPDSFMKSPLTLSRYLLSFRRVDTVRCGHEKVPFRPMSLWTKEDGLCRSIYFPHEYCIRALKISCGDAKRSTSSQFFQNGVSTRRLTSRRLLPAFQQLSSIRMLEKGDHLISGYGFNTLIVREICSSSMTVSER